MERNNATSFVPGYEDLVISGSATAKTWQHVVRDLPVYTLDGSGEPAYYRYSVSEAAVSGYDTTITGNDSTYTITNTERPIVPTGADSTRNKNLPVIAGLVLLFVLMGMKAKKRMR